ncbi:hypothetical protein J2T17_003672, partial [Paenibacillus mucilaginosus]
KSHLPLKMGVDGFFMTYTRLLRKKRKFFSGLAAGGFVFNFLF